MRSSPLEPGALLPHRGAALLIERILELHDDRITCVGRIPEDSPFAVDRRAPSFVAIELAAQAAGLLEAAGIPPGDDPGGPRLGYLVRVRRASFAGPFLPVEKPLEIHARRIDASPPLYLYEADLTVAGGLFFAGSLSTFVERG